MSSIDHLTVRMTGGGSHKAEKRVRYALERSGIEFYEGPFRDGFGRGTDSQRRVFWVAPKDVEKARTLGLRVSRKQD